MDLLGEAEVGVKFCLRILADPDVELLGFDDPLFCGGAPELQFFGAQFEVDRLFCACLQIHSLEAFELPYRARGAAGLLVNVELDNRIPGSTARVGHIYGNVKRGSNLRCGLTQLQILERESCIAEAVAEGIERSA